MIKKEISSSPGKVHKLRKLELEEGKKVLHAP